MQILAGVEDDCVTEKVVEGAPSWCALIRITSHGLVTSVDHRPLQQKTGYSIASSFLIDNNYWSTQYRIWGS